MNYSKIVNTFAILSLDSKIAVCYNSYTVERAVKMANVKITYQAQIGGSLNWTEVSAEKLLFLLLPSGIVTAYRKMHENIECAHVTVRGAR